MTCSACAGSASAREAEMLLPATAAGQGQGPWCNEVTSADLSRDLLDHPNPCTFPWPAQSPGASPRQRGHSAAVRGSGPPMGAQRHPGVPSVAVPGACSDPLPFRAPCIVCAAGRAGQLWHPEQPQCRDCKELHKARPGLPGTFCQTGISGTF